MLDFLELRKNFQNIVLTVFVIKTFNIFVLWNTLEIYPWKSYPQILQAWSTSNYVFPLHYNILQKSSGQNSYAIQFCQNKFWQKKKKFSTNSQQIYAHKICLHNVPLNISCLVSIVYLVLFSRITTNIFSEKMKRIYGLACAFMSFYLFWYVYQTTSEGTGNMLDGCYHVYLDMGTNLGVQIRKLYQPHLFPNATVLPVFDKYFGPIAER